MKIESDFQDYYDFIQEEILSLKPNMIFHRKTKSCNYVTSYHIKDILSDEIKTVKLFCDHSNHWTISFFIIGFCGVLYKGALINNTTKFDASYTFTGSVYLPSKLGIDISSTIEQNAEKHFSSCFIRNDQIFKTVNAPYFVIYPDQLNFIQIECNPNLTNYLFNKVKNAHRTYHEIKNYISNELSEFNQIEDIDQIKIYGENKKSPIFSIFPWIQCGQFNTI